jgi:hypothetical protein
VLGCFGGGYEMRSLGLSSIPRRRESVETDARAAPEERAAQEYLPYFEQRSDEAAARSQGIDARSRRGIEDSP